MNAPSSIAGRAASNSAAHVPLPRRHVEAFLRTQLAEGPRLIKDLVVAAVAEGITHLQLTVMRQQLGITSRKIRNGNVNSNVWSLPVEPAPELAEKECRV